MNRRKFLVYAAAVPLAFSRASAADSRQQMIVHTDPNCGCCGNWVTYLREAGFPVEVRATDAIDSVKSSLGVPEDLASCHTAEIGGYVVEGHVPAEMIDRLLSEGLEATGVSVPGMPLGSPGMEIPDTDPEEYDVVLFGPSGRRILARYLGGNRIEF